VQFIESSYSGVRSAIYRLNSPQGGPEFRLFPMLHIGAPSYYPEVRRRLAACDLIFSEGVDSPRLRFLMRTYERVASNLGLVTQHVLYSGETSDQELAKLRAKLVSTDVTTDEFEAGWRQVPLTERLAMQLGALVVRWHYRRYNSREELARQLGLDDLPSREELLSEGWIRRVTQSHQRDRKLLQYIGEYASQRGEGPLVIGILYGARQMRAVASYLLQDLHYRISDAEWVTVFDL
jgi:hypothetical protein